MHERFDITSQDSEMLSNSASTYYKSYDVTFYQKPQLKQYHNTKHALLSSTLIHETLRSRFDISRNYQGLHVGMLTNDNNEEI
ncbi:hypothetical protein T11_10459 [Trichinella zimbabwensis]|uniref:Uncharacterized protein n=1 Tax=Trichinella zimbabwensis TaxID=268475 RepID=A0A0V1GN94_9BILA|nr:hypothetical protein T11_10459 [Trichinella zimbabwensis]